MDVITRLPVPKKGVFGSRRKKIPQRSYLFLFKTTQMGYMPNKDIRLGNQI